jgi:hypothetical protein
MKQYIREEEYIPNNAWCIHYGYASKSASCYICNGLAQVGTERGRTLSFFYPRNDAILPWNIPFINNSSAKSTFPYLFSHRFAVFLRNFGQIDRTIRVVNFDSDGKSDQKIDIFSANQISAFLQQLTPPFRRFSEKNPIEGDVNWYFFVLVERTWWRLCHLSLELRLVQTGVRLKSELMLCSLPRSRLLSYHMLEVPPRRAWKKSQKNKFLSHVK